MKKVPDDGDGQGIPWELAGGGRTGVLLKGALDGRVLEAQGQSVDRRAGRRHEVPLSTAPNRHLGKCAPILTSPPRDWHEPRRAGHPGQVPDRSVWRPRSAGDTLAAMNEDDLNQLEPIPWYRKAWPWLLVTALLVPRRSRSGQPRAEVASSQVVAPAAPAGVPATDPS